MPLRVGREGRGSPSSRLLTAGPPTNRAAAQGTRGNPDASSLVQTREERPHEFCIPGPGLGTRSVWKPVEVGSPKSQGISVLVGTKSVQHNINSCPLTTGRVLAGVLFPTVTARSRGLWLGSQRQKEGLPSRIQGRKTEESPLQRLHSLELQGPCSFPGSKVWGQVRPRLTPQHVKQPSVRASGPASGCEALNPSSAPALPVS